MVEMVRMRVFIGGEDGPKVDGSCKLEVGAPDEINLDIGSDDEGVLVVINIQDLFRALGAVEIQNGE